jgi:hypothetical protein
MNKWESKSLPHSEEAVITVAQAATDTHAHAKVKRGVSIMAAEAGIAALSARDLAKEGGSGRTDQLPIYSPKLSKTDVAYTELCFATTHFCLLAATFSG